jgi:cell division protein FtsL
MPYTNDELLERINNQHEIIQKCESMIERQDDAINDLKQLVKNLERLLEIANSELKR